MNSIDNNPNKNESYFNQFQNFVFNMPSKVRDLALSYLASKQEEEEKLEFSNGNGQVSVFAPLSDDESSTEEFNPRK
jgi:hypothetical protein